EGDWDGATSLAFARRPGAEDSINLLRAQRTVEQFNLVNAARKEIVHRGGLRTDAQGRSGADGPRTHCRVARDGIHRTIQVEQEAVGVPTSHRHSHMM